MDTQAQARALMMRHYQFIRHRQQSMLERSLQATGMAGEVTQGWHHVQGKPSASARLSYDRSRASLS